MAWSALHKGSDFDSEEVEDTNEGGFKLRLESHRNRRRPGFHQAQHIFTVSPVFSLVQ